jgi:hypothetical protein
VPWRSGRSLLASTSSVALLVATALVASPARADDDPLRGPRIGFIPTIGAGVTAFTGVHAPFSSFIGESILQLDFVIDTGRWGGFARGAFFSSGNGGRWTTPVIALGGSYRLRGDGEETWGLVGRFGVEYQRWHADTGGCSVTLFIPDNCKDFTPPVMEGTVGEQPTEASVSVDHVGLFGGMSFEVPTEPVFVAIGTEVSATADVDHAMPGLAFSAQLTLSLALRDHVHDGLGSQAAPTRYQTRLQ